MLIVLWNELLKKVFYENMSLGRTWLFLQDLVSRTVHPPIGQTRADLQEKSGRTIFFFFLCHLILHLSSYCELRDVGGYRPR